MPKDPPKKRKPKIQPIEIELPPKEFLRKIRDVGRTGGFLAKFEEGYHRERNPLYAWEAYFLARKYKLGIPEWVLEYLDRTAFRLFEKPPKKDASRYIAKALNLHTRGKGNIYSRYFDLQDRLRAVEAVIRKIKKSPQEDLEQIYCEVAEEETDCSGKPISNVTVGKWFQEYRVHFCPKTYKAKPLPK